jgi:hypothetical protein
MRHLLFVFTLSALLSSCSLVYFDSPQPPFGDELNGFPDNFNGTYTSDGDTLTILGDHIEYSESMFKWFSDEPIISTDLKGLIFKQDGDLLLVNFPSKPDDDKTYYLLVLLEIKNGDLHLRSAYEDKDFGFHYDKPIKLDGGVKINYKDKKENEERKVDSYILSPTKKDWVQIKDILMQIKPEVMKRVG